MKKVTKEINKHNQIYPSNQTSIFTPTPTPEKGKPKILFRKENQVTKGTSKQQMDQQRKRFKQNGYMFTQAKAILLQCRR